MQARLLAHPGQRAIVMALAIAEPRCPRGRRRGAARRRHRVRQSGRSRSGPACRNRRDIMARPAPRAALSGARRHWSRAGIRADRRRPAGRAAGGSRIHRESASRATRCRWRARWHAVEEMAGAALAARRQTRRLSRRRRALRPGADPQRRLGFLHLLVNHWRSAGRSLWWNRHRRRRSGNQVPPWPWDMRSREPTHVGGRRMSGTTAPVRDSSLQDR